MCFAHGDKSDTEEIQWKTTLGVEVLIFSTMTMTSVKDICQRNLIRTYLDGYFLKINLPVFHKILSMKNNKELN